MIITVGNVGEKKHETVKKHRLTTINQLGSTELHHPQLSVRVRDEDIRMSFNRTDVKLVGRR